MKQYAPSYYLEFSCIADRCRHSCCVGWEIDVDEESMARYAALSCDYGAQIRQSIACEEEMPHFQLTAQERCPHLDERGLCRIITHLGEGYLCEICREHPRFYHITARTSEVGLGIACEEACRIVLLSDAYRNMVAVGEDDSEEDAQSWDVLPYRARLYEILSDRSVPYAERLRQIGLACGVSLSQYADREWRSLLDGLEYLDLSHKSLFSCYHSDAQAPKDWEAPLERALAYFLYRHASAAWDETSFCIAVGFSLFCERLLASIGQRGGMTVEEAARILSEELEYSVDNTEQIMATFA